jgi:UV DNA damage endonuclease
MKIGYPCVNTTALAIKQKTFRLASYSANRFIETVQHNITCLMNILRYNVKYNLLFFRIGSGLIPLF